MPQESGAAPGWFVKLINEGIKRLDRVATYLDDVMVEIFRCNCVYLDHRDSIRRHVTLLRAPTAPTDPSTNVSTKRATSSISPPCLYSVLTGPSGRIRRR